MGEVLTFHKRFGDQKRRLASTRLLAEVNGMVHQLQTQPLLTYIPDEEKIMRLSAADVRNLSPVMMDLEGVRISSG